MQCCCLFLYIALQATRVWHLPGIWFHPDVGQQLFAKWRQLGSEGCNWTLRVREREVERGLWRLMGVQLQPFEETRWEQVRPRSMHLMLLLLHCTSVHLCNPVRYLHITEFLQIEAHVKLEAQWVWHMKAHLKTQYEGKSATCTWCCCYTVHCAVCNPLKHGWQGFLKVEAHMELEAHRASFVETIWGQVRPRHIHLTLLYFECAFCATPFRHTWALIHFTHFLYFEANTEKTS